MTFEEWWYSKEIERGDEGINTSINTIKNLARQSWEAAQSEIKKQLEFEKEQTESQRSMKILARNQRDAVVALKGNHHDAISEAAYKAMLAAAPKMEQGEDKLINDISELFGIGINQRTHSVIMTNVKNSLEQSRESGKLAEALELLLDTEDQDCRYLDGHYDAHCLGHLDDGYCVAKAKAALASYYNGGEK